ncbi:hypothetical protein B6N60_04307 [Richelia sinica FACHB-800]|uniref:vWA-MoxR associated protein N-terminal HTH domain-containing protein n=1 Tax=Richelia sinica FACHB-800 TaxID=1357546 RepID=A0A975Y6S7_9NOST|nr:hypothetical protein B6N60_04307 [Richelia sinica FACHB-800]
MRGCLEGKYYRTIAKENGFSYHYVKEIGSEFWPILSEALGTKVIPRNIRAVIEPTFRTLTVTHQKKPPK